MGDELDGRADQYALAASAFHLLTGAPPFAHFNPSVVVNRQLNDRPPRPSEIRPDLTEFDAIFARALSQDPVDRYRRCRDFAKALESNGGTRSHIRATSELRAASIFREATDSTDAAPATAPATPRSDVVAPTAPNAAPRRLHPLRRPNLPHSLPPRAKTALSHMLYRTTTSTMQSRLPDLHRPMTTSTRRPRRASAD